jgi:anti-anti-sigma factor
MMGTPKDIELHETPEGGHVRLTVTGPVDLCTAWRLDGALDDLTSRGQDTVVDISGVTAIDPCGLRVLLDAEARTQPGHTLTISGARPHVRRIVDQTGLTGRLHLAA